MPAGLDIADPAISSIAPMAHQIVNKFCAMLLATVPSAAAASATVGFILG